MCAALALSLLTFAVAYYFSDFKKVKEYLPLAGENAALFLAIANAESSFSETAVSAKGAMGLCQIMPKTAEWCCEMLGITFDQNMLLTKEYNAQIANFYLEYLLNKFQNTEAAICAYNAGEGRVIKWLEDPEIYNGEKFVAIPFEETKNYLKKVQTNYKKYKLYLWLMGI